MSAHNSGVAAPPSPSPPPVRPLSPERPIHVVLETELPARKPGRPRLDISAHFQDTGEMANHSHRLVWCIGCIKSGRPLYRKDRLPARGDLMQRHLQSCKHVSDEVRAKFCSQRSSSASSAGESKARKTRIANIVTNSAPTTANNAHATSVQVGTAARARSRLRSATTASSMPAAASPTVLPPISAVASPKLTGPTVAGVAAARQPHGMYVGDADGVHLPQIRPLPPPPPPSQRQVAPVDLPPISHRAHPYFGRDQHHGQSSNVRLRALHASAGTSRSPPRAHTPPVPPYHQNHTYLPRLQPVPPPLQTLALAEPASTGSGALRRKLRHGPGAAFGIMLTIPSAVAARTAARLGFDWACIDMENSSSPVGTMAEMVAAVAGSGSCVPLVRVPSPSSEWIQWAVDAGAHGVIVPGIQSRDQMWRVVACSREAAARAPYTQHHQPFPLHAPSPVHQSSHHNHQQPYPSPRSAPPPQAGALATAAQDARPLLPAASGDVLVIPQIDQLGSGTSIEDILSVPGIDAAFVRPHAEPSGSGRSPRDMLGQALHVARKLGIPLGIDSTDGDAAQEGAHWGFQMVSVGRDVDVLAAAVADQLRRARSA